MWGTYQHSNLRIEMKASSDEIRRSLIQPSALSQWLSPQSIELGNSSVTPNVTQSRNLAVGQSFDSVLGPLRIHHTVDMLSEDGICFLLSEGIDGFHEWQWGDGWIQSRLEGVSLLPLNLGQTASILRLRHYLQA
ncbi:MAG: hypothetical protein AAF703_22735 [Cyanobacteria bacterium P01_D01_bin.105]